MSTKYTIDRLAGSWCVVDETGPICSCFDDRKAAERIAALLERGVADPERQRPYSHDQVMALVRAAALVVGSTGGKAPTDETSVTSQEGLESTMEILGRHWDAEAALAEALTPFEALRKEAKPCAGKCLTGLERNRQELLALLEPLAAYGHRRETLILDPEWPDEKAASLVVSFGVIRRARRIIEGAKP